MLAWLWQFIVNLEPGPNARISGGSPSRLAWDVPAYQPGWPLELKLIAAS